MKIYTKLLSVAIAVILVFSSMGVFPVFAAQTNVFRGQSIDASVGHIADAVGPSYMLDGNAVGNDSRYASVTGPDKALVITITLDAMYDLSKINIVESIVEAGTTGNNVTVEVGIKTDLMNVWQTVVSGESLVENPANDGYRHDYNNEFTFDTVTGDVVRITLEQASYPGLQYQIAEIYGYGVKNEEASMQRLENFAQGSTVSSSIAGRNEFLSSDMMTDGDLDSRFAGPNDYNTDLEVILDLQSVKKISHIAVLERWITATCSDKTNIDIGLTTDGGVLWKSAVKNAPLKNGARDGDVVENVFSLKNPAFGDKLRFTFDRESSTKISQYEIVELAVFGNENTDIVKYEIDSVTFEKGGAPADSISAGNAVIKVAFPYEINADSSGKEVLLLGGVYDKTTNEQKLAFEKPVKLGAVSGVQFVCDAQSDWTNSDIRAFLWADGASLRPVSATVSMQGSDFAGASASSDGVADVDVNLAQSTVTVCGTLPAASKSVCAAIVVLHTDYDNSALSSGEVASIAAHFAQISTAADGSYSYSFVMDSDMGFHSVWLVREDTGEMYKATDAFMFYDSDDLEIIADLFVPSANLNSLLETYADIFPISSASNRSRVAAYLAKELETNANFANYAALQKAYRESLVFIELDDASNGSDFGAVMEANSAALGFGSLDAYVTYDASLSAQQKSQVLEALASSTVSHLSEYKKLFTDTTILTAVNSASNWRGLKAIIDQNDAALSAAGLDYGAYSALCSSGKNSAADIEVLGARPYTSLSTLASKIDLAVANANKSDDKDNNRKGGGGGGGSVVATVPTPVPEQGTQTNVPAVNFTDMQDAQWAIDAVAYLSANGIVNGRTSTEFAPAELVKREEFVKMVVIALAELSGGKADFDDVGATDWFYPYIGAACSQGIVNGVSEASFGVGMSITRQDMAVIICRALERTMSLEASTKVFKDSADISAYALDSVAKLADIGIISGFEDGSFAPAANATRAQAAKMIYNAIRYREVK